MARNRIEAECDLLTAPSQGLDHALLGISLGLADQQGDGSPAGIGLFHLGLETGVAAVLLNPQAGRPKTLGSLERKALSALSEVDHIGIDRGTGLHRGKLLE